MGQTRKSRRAGGCVTAGALVAASVAVAFGTGFTASRALLREGGAWLSKGDTVAHVNASTAAEDATVDAELVDEIGDQEIVTPADADDAADDDAGRPGDDGGSGHVAVVDHGTGDAGTDVEVVDPTTMRPGASLSLPAWPDRPADVPRYLLAGDLGYAISETEVQPVDPVTLRPAAEPVTVGRVGGAVPTREGTLAVLDAEHGTVVEIAGGEARIPVEVARPGDGGRLALTAVSGRPVVVDTAAGQVRRLAPGGSAEDPWPVDELRGRDLAGLAVAGRGADGSTAWVVERSSGNVVGVDLDTGEVRSGAIPRHGARIQPPVVFRGLVYVPDGSAHDVVVIRWVDGAFQQVDVHEPPGHSERLEVFSQVGRVWINDPAERTALVVEADGITHDTVDKGDGHRVVDSREDEIGTPPADVGPTEPGSGPNPPPPAPGPSPAPADDADDAGPVDGDPSPDDTTGTPPGAPATPPEADVPDVVGRPIDDACGRVEAALLHCVRRPTVDAPDGTESGTVLGQDPATGTRPQGTDVTLTYYEVEPVAVPDVRGVRVQQTLDVQQGPACQAIVAATFTCQGNAIAAADGQPADEVLDQDPAAGTEGAPGSGVTLTYASTTLVPTVAGLQIDAACAAIEALNLVCVPQVGAPGPPAGQVTTQDLAAGAAVQADTEVVVTHSPGLPVVPNVIGLPQADACAALTAQNLGCAPAINSTNSINNPNLVDAQSIPAGQTAAAGTIVSVFRPAGPDATIHRFQAYDGNTPLEQWAIGTDAGGGRAAYDVLTGRPGDWQRNGTLGRCYTTQVAGSIPLYAFIRPSADPNHESHFYAAGYSDDPASQYQRGITYYGAPSGTFCYVVPWGTPGAAPVTEWWKGQSHFYNINERPPGPGYHPTPIPQWATW